MTNDLITTYVDTADFTELFVQLGWDRPRHGGRAVNVESEGDSYTLNEVATFKGITIWAAPGVPLARVQREIDRQMRNESAERVLIFHDADRQQWRWPQTRDADGTGTRRLVAHEHVVGRENPALEQRLELIEIGIDERLSVLEVTRRLRKAFNADRITKKFYTEYAKQHRILCDHIDGIDVSNTDENPEVRWYASLLLNRLMFIYFMQRKGFLANDLDYLRNRLVKVESLSEVDGFYEFYRDFLIPLFHDGLGTEAGADGVEDEAIRELIGDLPYVNGGIFAPHPLETENEIRIPDIAFKNIFDFFDMWQWHLDDRPTGNPKEVNPDMLGYIFEQFVNNREEVATGSKAAQTNADKGAYYTKEDVTGYMTANTLIPVFLERLEKRTSVNPWQRLQHDPDRLIWPSVLHGVDQQLPEDLRSEPDTWSRSTWEGVKPDNDLALPAESWWEVLDRRQHVKHLRMLMRDGGIATVEDAVTHNLDLETLAVDCIDGLDNPDDVAEAWDILTELRIIDPTCGSGAFLFAALGILHTLYGATLDAAERHAKTRRTDRLNRILSGVDSHANRDYYLLKHATLKNLYGVDLMPEATEIARLRLFLKLIAQIEHRDQIEPLPDLDFNIKAGNALVGALDEESIRDRVSVLSYDRVDDLVAEAAEASATYRAFTDAQDHGTEAEVREAKAEHQTVSSNLRGVLHGWWHEADGKKQTIESYLDVHKPFHWFIEFVDVFSQGGFDVVIGNPPYVATTKIEYKYSGFRTDGCSDIYAPCLERAAQITAEDGRLSMIVPMNLSWGGEFKTARAMLLDKFTSVWASTYDQMPSRLFEGVGTRNTIVLAGGGGGGLRTTTFNKWVSEFRPHLLPTQRYIRHAQPLEPWPKVGHQSLVGLAAAPRGGMRTLAPAEKRTGYRLGYKKTANYWISVFVEDPPCLDANRNPKPQTKVGDLYFGNDEDQMLALAVGASRVMFLWWVFVGDAFDVLGRDFLDFPLRPQQLSDADQSLLIDVGRSLAKRLSEAGPHLLWTPYKQAWYGNFDLTKCRDLTDRADDVLLRHFGLTDAKFDFEVEFNNYMKASGERPGTVRGAAPDRDR